MRRFALTALTILAACSARDQAAMPTSDRADADKPACETLDNRTPNGADQKPAFAGQTRACRTPSNVAYDVTVVAKGLDHPWSVEPLPGGDLLVTERAGRLRIVSANGAVGQPIAGLPEILAGGQGGLLDVALSPAFETDRTIFWSFTEPRSDGNGTSVARGVLSADRTRVEQARVIFRALPSYSNTMHYGSRLAFAPDGKLFITTGERSDKSTRHYAQETSSHLGKVMRINADGTVPADNPFVGQAGARGEVWSLGHRNVQASAIDAQGQLWTIEHGTRGGDELNRIERGKNYGWPVQAYGIEYAGGKIDGSSTAPAGYEQPAYYWDPVIAPSGAQFYTGDAFPAWKNSLFVGALKEQRLVRLVIDASGRVTGEEHLLTDRGQRVRDVRQGPDGFLYLVTDEGNGEVWRVSPKR